MKSLIYAGLIIGLCFSACKKDKDDTPSGVIPYSAAAPKCLISTMRGDQNGISFNVEYKYDEQKRLISQIETGGSYRMIFSYTGDTMTILETIRNNSTDTVNMIIRHSLNTMGFIKTTINPDGNRIFYTYDKQGYLIRALVMEASGEYIYGSSHQYANGNRISTYNLDVNPETGTTQDSTLAYSFVYYDNLAGKVEEADAWTERNGRGSKNELKSRIGKTLTWEYEYTIGDNGLPSSLNYKTGTETTRIGVSWKCN